MAADVDQTKLHVRLSIPSGWEESLIWCLQEEGWGTAVAVAQFPAGLLGGEEAPRREQAELAMILEQELRPAFERRLAEWAAAFGWPANGWRARFEARPNEDWEAAWRRRWRAFRCAGFVIHADFHAATDLPLRPGDQPLGLRAGSAFGTGGHVSTRFALRCIRSWFESPRPPQSVLDLGTGSGILAVAAALLGAHQVAGMDPDPASARQASETAALNRVEPACRFWRGTLESVGGRWNAVIANLHSDLIAEHAGHFARLCGDSGRLFVGGILDRKGPRTLAALERAGFRLERRWQRGRWLAATFWC